MGDADREYLVEMLEYAELARELLGSATNKAVAGDRQRFAALCYAVQTIGEAANQVSAENRVNLTEISWHKVIGMRHRIVHGYRSLVPDILINAVREDIPPLIVSLRRALENNAK